MIMRVMYLLTFGVLYTLSLLPLRILYLLSDVLCLLAYRVVGYRRRLVRQHLRDSFPGRTDRQLAAIEHGFYAWFCDYIVETVKLFSMSPRQMRRRMVFKGTDYVTSPMTHRGQVIYAVGIGVLTVVIRNWGSYPEGMSFAILIMNAFTPLINFYVKPKRFGEVTK